MEESSEGVVIANNEHPDENAKITILRNDLFEF